MIVPQCAVAGLIVLASSTSRTASAQPFPTLPAKILDGEPHSEFGNVAENSSNTASGQEGGADDGRPGTFQFLGGGGEDEDDDDSTTSARSRSEGVVQEAQAAAEVDDAAVPTAAPTMTSPTIA